MGTGSEPAGGAGRGAATEPAATPGAATDPARSHSAAATPGAAADPARGHSAAAAAASPRAATDPAGCHSAATSPADSSSAAATGAASPGQRSLEAVDLEILDSVAEMFGFLVQQGDEIARRLGVPGFFIKALHLLDHPMAMKDLGRRMHCDPSFVTGIADMLEQRQLAVREPDPADRRVKRLVLTPAGEELKRALEAEVVARMPWRQALDAGERTCLLGHLTTVVRSLREQAGSAAGGGRHPGLARGPQGGAAAPPGTGRG